MPKNHGVCHHIVDFVDEKNWLQSLSIGGFKSSITTRHQMSLAHITMVIFCDHPNRTMELENEKLPSEYSTFVFLKDAMPELSTY